MTCLFVPDINLKVIQTYKKQQHIICVWMKNDKIAAHTHEIYIFSKDFV